MKEKALCGLVAVGMMLLTGCMTTIPVNRTSCSIPVAQGKYTLVKSNVYGSSDYWNILGLFTIDTSLNQSAQRIASDEALAQAPGADALVNVTTDFKTLNILYLFHRYRTYVTGDAVKLND